MRTDRQTGEETDAHWSQPRVCLLSLRQSRPSLHQDWRQISPYNPGTKKENQHYYQYQHL